VSPGLKTSPQPAAGARHPSRQGPASTVTERSFSDAGTVGSTLPCSTFLAGTPSAGATRPVRPSGTITIVSPYRRPSRSPSWRTLPKHFPSRCVSATPLIPGELTARRHHQASLNEPLAVNLLGPTPLPRDCCRGSSTPVAGSSTSSPSLPSPAAGDTVLPVVQAAACSIPQSLPALHTPTRVRVHAVLAGPIETEESQATSLFAKSPIIAAAATPRPKSRCLCGSVKVEPLLVRWRTLSSLTTTPGGCEGRTHAASWFTP
jgi:hypothetical protein